VSAKEVLRIGYAGRSYGKTLYAAKSVATFVAQSFKGTPLLLEIIVMDQDSKIERDKYKAALEEISEALSCSNCGTCPPCGRGVDELIEVAKKALE
jgi:hypothetical protein